MTNPLDVSDDDRPSNTLELFTELTEVLALIVALPQTIQAGSFEKSYETFSERLSRYQEQPHLLDPHLDQLLVPLLAYVRKSAALPALAHASFKYMYQLSKVRTYKVLVKSLPHDITDLDYVLGQLERQGLAGNAEQWESRYMLLLWLSILVLNPFQMSRLDGDDGTATNGTGDRPLLTAERIYRVCQTNTNNNDSCATVAAYLVSRYLIRVDIKDTYLPQYLDWIRDAHPTDATGVRTGQLDAIASILKHGKREDLLPHTDQLLNWVLGCNYQQLGDYLKSKLFVKIVQRVGLVMLRPRLAAWRYKRGQRSLTANLASGAAGGGDGAGVGEIEFEATDDDGIVVPDAIEDVIEVLLQSLRSPSGAIRWSAAKGIGRVCGRLPRALGDEVIGSVIEILSPLEPNEAWHGGCLAIAELSKRGLLLPERLAIMVPILQQALIYDQMNGYMSVGQHIRDAACYVAWAFARAYEPEVLEPFVARIAAGLLVTTVFDREINCRRAASAAFQECVGRLGNFPHGIDILTAADFYSVGVRANAYLQISDFVAQFVEYRRPLIDHLVEQKVGHWDTAIRELTAKTISRLTVRDPAYMADEVLGRLIKGTNSIDVNLRHGAVLAIGEIVRALVQIEREAGNGGTVWLTAERTRNVNDLLLKFLKRDQFRGMSGDIMRHCCCDFIRNCSLADISVSPECLDAWQTIIDDCMTRKSTQLREGASEALAVMAGAYYERRDSAENVALVRRYLLNSDDSLEENIRMGCVSAVGALPAFMLSPCREEVQRALIRHSLKPNVSVTMDTQTQLTQTWAESRRDSVRAIGRVVATFAYGRDANVDGGVDVPLLDGVFQCLLQALLEYTVDDRGDIGAWVREAAMTELYTMVTKCPISALQPDTIHAIMTGFCQQATEIIDRTRGLAGSLFWKMIYHEPSIPHIPCHDELRNIFPADASNVLWIYADHTFPLFCSALRLPEYSPRLLIGLSASMGKLSESLVKHASGSLFQFLRAHPGEVRRLCAEVLVIFASNLQNDAISHPLLNFLDVLLASGTVNAELLDAESTFADEVYRLTKLEHKGQRKLYKLVSSINVFCQLLQVPRLSSKVLSTLAIYLGMVHVHVRKCTATKLYEAIVIHGDTCGTIPVENIDDILELLSETDWGLPLTDIRPIRNRLCTLLNIKPPVAVENAPKK